jgi:hypothetical protein
VKGTQTCDLTWCLWLLLRTTLRRHGGGLGLCAGGLFVCARDLGVGAVRLGVRA